jgi:hypothetical protein
LVLTVGQNGEKGLNVAHELTLICISIFIISIFPLFPLFLFFFKGQMLSAQLFEELTDALTIKAVHEQMVEKSKSLGLRVEHRPADIHAVEFFYNIKFLIGELVS